MLSLTSKATTALTASLLSFSAFSATSNNENPLSGSGELGFNDSTGNTVNTSLYGALKLNYTQKNYVIKSSIEANYKSENGTQTEERYIIDVQGNRYYSENKSYYSFVGAKFEKNQFSDIELDSTFSLGLGENLYKTQATTLTGEIGLGHQNTDFVTQGVASKSQSVVLGKLDLTHRINAQVIFTQDLAISAGETQSKIESNTGFKVKVAEKMNLKASYKVRHNDKPADGKEKTDTQTILTLIYDF